MKRYILTFYTDDKDHIISGETFHWKDAIKALSGARWSPSEKVWRIPLSTGIDSLLTVYDKHLDDTVPSYGKCCRHAQLYSSNGGFDQSDPGFWFSALYYVCTKHGTRSFSKKPGYTGD